MDANVYIGKLLDSRYKVKSVIGKGGSACVFHAEDTLLHRAVALKILEDDKNEFCLNAKSFDTEAKAISMLSHPNIVNVYDISVGGDIKYIVMEHVEGITLRTYLNHKKVLPPSEVVSCARQVLRGLREAHNKGIVHRDIKPQNIMIMKNGQIKVADFGIARLPDRDRFHMPDRSIGTVHYISPEQARGNEVDARSDLYSLAIVMYEMATGVRPFEADTPSDVAIMQVTDTPVRPSEVNPDVPRELENVIMCALSKKPENRYESATDMLRVLERMNFQASAPAAVAATVKPSHSIFGKKKAKEVPVSEQPEQEVFENSAEQNGQNTSPVLAEENTEEKIETAAVFEEFDDTDEVSYEPQNQDETPSEEEAQEPLESEEQEEKEQRDENDDSETKVIAVAFSEDKKEEKAKEKKKKKEKKEKKQKPPREPKPKKEKKPKVPKPKKEKTQKAPKEPKKAAQNSNTNKKATIFIIVALVLLLAAITAAVVMLIANATREVPDFVGKHIDTVGSSYFTLAEEEEYSRYPEGTIIKQSPKAGKKLGRGETVTVVKSAGPMPFSMPIPEAYDINDEQLNVMGQLKTQLDRLDIEVTIKVVYELSTEYAKGIIFPGTIKAYDGGVLLIRVSAGSEPEYVEMENLVGMRVADAVSFLEENSIAYEIVFSETETAQNVGTVVAQSVAEGSKAVKYIENRKVIITVGALK